MHPAIIVAGVGVAAVGLGVAAVVGTAAMGNSNNATGDCPFTTQQVSNVTTIGEGDGASGSGANNAPLFQTIISMSGGNNRAVAAGLLGSDLESGWRNDATNSASATGPWQILLSVHPEVTPAEAEDPVISTHIWFPQYLKALPSIPDSEWTTDPEQAAEEVAVIAEVPGPSYYQLEGADTVHAKWQQTLQVMAKYGISTDFSSNAAGAPSTGTVTLVSAVFDNSTGSTGECTDGVYQDNGVADTTGNSAPPNASEMALVTGVPAAAERQIALTAAEQWIGTPYSFGGGNANGPTTGICTNDAGWNDCHIVGFDCSGLTLYAYAKDGIGFPHLAATQWDMTSAFSVSLDTALPGDLLFFTGSDGSPDAPGHVGIYLGNGKMIDAPESDENIRVDDITTPFWQSEFVGATDPFAYQQALGHST